MGPDEELITLPKAARTMKRGNPPVRTSLKEVISWATTGYRGVVLECVLVDGVPMTSKEAIARFQNAVVAAALARRKAMG
jgi:hypothetical protein